MRLVFSIDLPVVIEIDLKVMGFRHALRRHFPD
jgi:hypothetical protein